MPKKRQILYPSPDSDPQEPHKKTYKKRIRTVMTTLQSKTLRNAFKRNHFPSTDAREELARSLGMSARSVQIWFQNQRQQVRNRYRFRCSVGWLRVLQELAVSDRERFDGLDWSGLMCLARAAEKVGVK